MLPLAGNNAHSVLTVTAIHNGDLIAAPQVIPGLDLAGLEVAVRQQVLGNRSIGLLAAHLDHREVIEDTLGVSGVTHQGDDDAGVAAGVELQSNLRPLGAADTGLLQVSGIAAVLDQQGHIHGILEPAGDHVVGVGLNGHNLTYVLPLAGNNAHSVLAVTAIHNGDLIAAPQVIPRLNLTGLEVTVAQQVLSGGNGLIGGGIVAAHLDHRDVIQQDGAGVGRLGRELQNDRGSCLSLYHILILNPVTGRLVHPVLTADRL